MIVPIYVKRSFKTDTNDSDYLIREYEVEEIYNHYLFKYNVLLVPGGNKTYWFIAKTSDRILYNFFSTKRQALKFLKAVS